MYLAAIVFDFDGVIADSEPLHLRSFQQILAEEGVGLAERDYYERYLGYSDVGTFIAIGGDHDRTWTPDQIAALVIRKAAAFEALERDASVLYPGAEAAIRRAAAATPVAIASGSLRDEIVRVLDRARLTHLLAAIVPAG